MKLGNNQGFTVIELLVVITLISFVVAITIAGFNYGYFNVQKRQISSKILSDLSMIENGFTSYIVDKNAYPSHNSNLLLDSNFVPRYLSPPKVDDNFDKNYGLNGYLVFSNNRGYYICARTTAKSTDVVFSAIKFVAGRLPESKFFYNTGCAANSNMEDPQETTTIYITYWLVLNS